MPFCCEDGSPQAPINAALADTAQQGSRPSLNMRPLPLAVREKWTRRTEGAESMIVGIDFACPKERQLR
jgi:hypothetical protein